MGFLDEIAKALGITIGIVSRGTKRGYAYEKKVSSIKDKTEKLWDKYEEALSKVNKKTGNTLAKDLFLAKSPQWFELEQTLPERIMKRIKKESGIED